MANKTVWSLASVCFSMSTLLSLAGIISVIQVYFDVSIYFASLYAALFAGTLGFSSLITPALFSRYEKKKIITIILIITIVCNLIELIISNYYMGLVFRIIPAFFYPIAISSALTIVSEISPHETNKVVLGITTGSILGFSITSYLGFSYGYTSAILWFCAVNILSLILTIAYIPQFEGNKEPVVLQISHGKSKLFILSIIFIFCINIGVSITYNYIPMFLNDVTNMGSEMLFFALLFMGLASMVGTSLYGYLIERKANLYIFIYPILFISVVFILRMFIKYPNFEFVILIFFGLLDGSLTTVAQYWITSAARKAPEFANGIFLFVYNLSIFLGTMIGGLLIENISILFIFIGSLIMMLISIPFVILRVKLYPNVK